ncbi:MAG TPA: hypothetical protein PLA12_05130, partial [Candidatus Hydrogenedens sp.]|nr:hypothetical protein [Candidatus Hydrogenedens sp.]
AQVSPGSAVNLVISTGPCQEGTQEGEGITEGEGTHEGVVEGTHEGTHEGEGEGGGTDKGCGCNRKSTGGDVWLKYFLDFILVGMLMLAMSGMQKERYPSNGSKL